MKKTLIGLSAVLMLAGAVGVSPAQASSILIPPFAESGIGMTFQSANGDTTAIGQTFVLPNATDVLLDSFSLWIDDEYLYIPGDQPVALRGYVYAWDGSEASGPSLYGGSPTPTLTGFYNYLRLDFFTGGVALTPGTQYIALVTGIPAVYRSDGAVLFNETGPYAPGALFFTYHTNLTQPWMDIPYYSGSDLVFEAQFSPQPVPEPASLLLFGTGLVGVRAWRKRRQ